MNEKKCCRVVLAVSMFLFCAAARAQSDVAQIREKLKVCLSKGFDLKADCYPDSLCYVLRGVSATGDFPAKVALSGAKLKEMWTCFERCKDGGCFSDTLIDEIEPIKGEL